MSLLYKLENGQPIPCPTQAIINGAWTGNLHASESLQRQAGYEYTLQLTDAPQGNYRPIYAIDGNSIVQSWEEFTPSVIPLRFDKLQARRAFRSLGREDAWDTFTGALTGEAKKDFDNTPIISMADEKVAPLIDVFLGMAGLTYEQAETAIKQQIGDV